MTSKRSKKKPHVAMLGPYPPSEGGIATTLQNIINSPLKYDFDFRLVHTSSRKQGFSDHYKENTITRICRIILDLLCFIILIRKEPIDIVHIHTSVKDWAFWRDSTFMIAATFFSKPVFLQIHSGDLDKFLNKFGQLTPMVVKFLLKLPAIIGVLSKDHKRKFEKIVNTDKVIKLSNILHAELPESLNDINKEKSTQPGEIFFVLFASIHLSIEKGINEIIKASLIVNKKRNDVQFLIVGGNARKNQIKIYQKELPDSIKFLGKISHRNVLNIMKSADIFVLPSHREQFPMVLIEAMSVGLPIIATNVGAIPEIIINGVNGLIIEVKDYKSLAEKIFLLLDNSTLREKMKMNNKIKVNKKYSQNAAGDLFGPIYEDLLMINCST